MLKIELQVCFDVLINLFKFKRNFSKQKAYVMLHKDLGIRTLYVYNTSTKTVRLCYVYTV